MFFSFGLTSLFLPCYAPCVVSASARVCLLLAHTQSTDWRENTEPTKRLFLVLPGGKLTASTAIRVSRLWDRIYDSDVSIFDPLECHMHYIFWSQRQYSWIGDSCRYFQNKTVTSSADIWKQDHINMIVVDTLKLWPTLWPLRACTLCYLQSPCTVGRWSCCSCCKSQSETGRSHSTESRASGGAASPG